MFATEALRTARLQVTEADAGFNPTPGGPWGQTPAVDRLAFDLTTTDATGQSRRLVAVYLRRGRVLLGVYFPHPETAQPAVSGQTSLAAIVKVFASRMAQLPASVVNRLTP